MKIGIKIISIILVFLKFTNFVLASEKALSLNLNDHDFDDFIIPEIEKINLDEEEFKKQFGEDIEFHEKLENSEDHLKCLNIVNTYISNFEENFKSNFNDLFQTILSNRINIIHSNNKIYEVSKYKYVLFLNKNFSVTNERKLKSSIFDILFYDMILSCKKNKNEVKNILFNDINDLNNANSVNKKLEYFSNVFNSNFIYIKEKLNEISNNKINQDYENMFVENYKSNYKFNEEKDLFDFETFEKKLYVPDEKVSILKEDKISNETEQFSVKLLLLIIGVLGMIAFLIYSKKEGKTTIKKVK